MTRVARLALMGLLWSLLGTGILADDGVLTCRQVGDWCVCETDHFSVWGSPGSENIQETATLCERLRTALQDVWLPNRQSPPWSSKCVVVLHASPTDYAVAVSQPGTRSVGCTTLKLNAGRVTFRRIDLRCDRTNWKWSALPHELTHAVLADRNGGEPLPLWADEGLAVLSEPEATRAARDDALISAVRSRHTLPIPVLLRMQSQPPSEGRDAFYGQSAVLVAQLIERESPAAFLAFLDRARKVGDETALRQCYGIDGIAGLAQLWSDFEKDATPGQLVKLTGRATILPDARVASVSGAPSSE